MSRIIRDFPIYSSGPAISIGSDTGIVTTSIIAPGSGLAIARWGILNNGAGTGAATITAFLTERGLTVPLTGEVTFPNVGVIGDVVAGIAGNEDVTTVDGDVLDINLTFSASVASGTSIVPWAVFSAG